MNRAYLMASPEFFTIAYEINPWMDASTPVDANLARKQWQGLRETLESLGHTVHVLDAAPGLPDFVYAANGGFCVDGVFYGAKFRYPERADEADLHAHWFTANDWTVIRPTQTNEGEGDIAFLAGPGTILAGYGFRTEVTAHQELQEAVGRPVVSLRLVDPRFYHLDTALAVLDDETITYWPGAFSDGSRRTLERMFPDAIIADEADATAFGLNLVSDGRRVVMNAEATAMAAKLAARGYEPHQVELGELKKGGGSVKCCVAELRSR